MDKKAIYLAIGVIATLIFMIFRVEIFEALYTAPGFSDEMYNHNVYTLIACIDMAVSWCTAAQFYYTINSVKFSRWYHWLAVLALVTLLTPIACYLVNNSIFQENNLGYGGDALSFELMNMLIVAVLFTTASFSMRWWSSNCRHTPFPQ